MMKFFCADFFQANRWWRFFSWLMSLLKKLAGCQKYFFIFSVESLNAVDDI